MAAGGGLTMAGAAIELAVVYQVENGHGIVSEPFYEGRAGTLMRAAKTCTAAGAGLTVVAGRTRLGAVASGTLLAAGSLLTRFGGESVHRCSDSRDRRGRRRSPVVGT